MDDLDRLAEIVERGGYMDGRLSVARALRAQRVLAAVAPELIAVARDAIAWRRCDLEPGECECRCDLDIDARADRIDALMERLAEVMGDDR